jgi:hypothetical protein
VPVSECCKVTGTGRYSRQTSTKENHWLDHEFKDSIA